ncbi:2-amino-4-hydroxy-6-hydroxymethyldihydropteridine diphosphokinase [Limibacterium fermenti]|jgi:2-amino-4-hydroxy-6-hydroxymethyldihydropteridine diphosphokinase|uniref:2-amino-4-hydroxy-6- hydroxymethyldihydropteridine diphosphokinase n=1 Tax=Limibacterium fermenti TaxID=3229863 RepID=UPI0026C1B7A6
MHEILLSIGSNIYAKANIDKAKRMLHHIFPEINFTPTIINMPGEGLYPYPFRNALAMFQSDLTSKEIIEKVKRIESALGRTPQDKEIGKVVIDIDVLKYDDEILRPSDYERNYVQYLMNKFESA